MTDRGVPDSPIVVPITTVTAEERIYALEQRLASMEDRMFDMWARIEGNRKSTYPSDGVPIDPGLPPLPLPPKADPMSPRDGNQAPVSRVQIMINKVESDGVRRDQEEFEVLPHDDHGKNRPAALLRKFQNNDSTGSSELHIQDKVLQDLIKEILAEWPYHIYIGAQMIITSPFVPLVFNWDLLVFESKKEDPDEKRKKAREDLGLCLDAIGKGSGDEKLDNYFKIRDDLKASGTISYDSLWTLFPPGEIVYSHIFLKNVPDQDQIFIVNGFESGWPSEDPMRMPGTPNKWTVHCWTYDLNATAKHFQRKDIRLSIDQFKDRNRLITQLPVYPISYMEPSKRKAVMERLLERGKMYRQICASGGTNRMWDFTGDAVYDDRGIRRAKIPDPFELPFRGQSMGKPKITTPLVDCNVIVDYESHNRYGPRDTPLMDNVVSDNFEECECLHCLASSSRKEKTKPQYDDVPLELSREWEDLQYQLCPPRVLGCVLKEMQWAQLAVTMLKAIKPQTYDEAMARLFLEGRRDGEDKKKLLYGLVQSHGAVKIDDIVAEKGQGLVFLLYGKPGVGKTSTAQMIARAAQRPLFSIGVAHVGTEGKDVEANLETIFALATRWKAILLIDEADVFLQSRNNNSLAPSPDSSALVSVFLRVLEYYQGILFLTTNQIAQFDIAVQSRVHIALRYEELGPDQTYEIFMSFIRMLDDQGMVNRNDLDDIESFVTTDLPRKKFDGRQLRNIVTCAVGYAKSMGREKLNMRDIKLISAWCEDFKQDLAGQMKTYQDSIKRARCYQSRRDAPVRILRRGSTSRMDLTRSTDPDN